MDLPEHSKDNKNDTKEKKRRNLRRRRLLWEVMLDFAKNTTLHGLRYVTERGLSQVEKISWILIFLMSVTASTVLIHNVWVKWQTNQPIVTFSERLTYVTEVPFPAVTICPHQKIDQTVYNYTKSFTQYLNNLGWKARPSHEQWEAFLSNQTQKLKLKKSLNELAWIRLTCSDNLGYTRWFRSLVNRSHEDHNTVLNIIKAAPKLENVYLSSRLFGKNLRDLHRYYNQVLMEEGVCYTFNSLPADEILNIDIVQKNYSYLNKSSTRREQFPERGDFTSKYGRYLYKGRANSYVPDLEIILRQVENRDNLCDGNEPGFKVYLHHPGDLPQSSLYYYTATPDHVNSFAISVDVLKTSDSLIRCPLHIRQCYFPGEKKLKYFRVYSEKNCRLECHANYTLRYCKCVWFHVPHNDSTVLCTFTHKFCADISLDQLISNDSFSKESANQCQCLPSCEYIQYKAEIMRRSAQFQYQENQTYINMYFKESTFVSRARECSGMFEFADFLAYCGGLLGLFLGFSILSVFEIFYFCTLRLEEGVPGEFGKVCHIKKQRRKRQKLLIIDSFLDFAKNTTLHGLRYITEVGLTAVEKVFWVLTFLISLTLCFVLIERVWHKWWYSPVIVSFNEKMVPVGEVPFPSITICPQWKCKKSAYNYTEKFIKYRGKRNVQNHTYEEKKMLEDAFLVCDDFYSYLLNDRYTSDESLVNNLIEMAPMVNETMIMCTWRGEEGVSCEDKFKTVLTSEGICYNFNSLSYNDIFRTKSIQSNYKYLHSDTPINKWDIISGYTTNKKAKRKKSQKRGRNKTIVEEDLTHLEEYPRRGQENGAQPDLEILLLEDSEDIDESCNSLKNGWKIYLQHPADMPQASLYYYAAIPKQITSLALKFTVLNTSESLMGYKSDLRQCFFPDDRKLDYFATYTPDNCRLECLSKYTYKRCKCVWYHMPHVNSSEICTVRKRKCVQKAQDELASNKLKQGNCNCLPSCDSIHYDAEILKTNLDIKKYRKAMKRVYDFDLSETYGYSRLEIYFKEPRFVSMRRSELFGLTDFLANCGGLLGLFLGFSFLSLVEIFYFCTLRLWCTLKKDIKIEKKKLKDSVYKK